MDYPLRRLERYHSTTDFPRPPSSIVYGCDLNSGLMYQRTKTLNYAATKLACNSAYLCPSHDSSRLHRDGDPSE